MNSAKSPSESQLTHFACPFICCTSRSRSRRSHFFSILSTSDRSDWIVAGYIWPQFSSPYENSSCWSLPKAVEISLLPWKFNFSLFYGRFNHDCRRLDSPFPLYHSLRSQYNSKVKPSTLYSANSGGGIFSQCALHDAQRYQSLHGFLYTSIV